MRDTVAAKASYGPYVTPVSIDTSSGQLLRRVLKGCASVVCLGRSGALPEAARDAGVEQLVLLSAAGSKVICYAAPQPLHAPCITHTQTPITRKP